MQDDYQTIQSTRIGNETRLVYPQKAEREWANHSKQRIKSPPPHL